MWFILDENGEMVMVSEEESKEWWKKEENGDRLIIKHTHVEPDFSVKELEPNSGDEINGMCLKLVWAPGFQTPKVLFITNSIGKEILKLFPSEGNEEEEFEKQVQMVIAGGKLLKELVEAFHPPKAAH
jgi:hypothetical protein